MEESEYPYTICRSDINFAVRDCGHDEFVTGTEVVAAVGGLVAVAPFIINSPTPVPTLTLTALLELYNSGGILLTYDKGNYRHGHKALWRLHHRG